MNGANLENGIDPAQPRRLPRLVSLHQLAQRSGMHRSALTLLMLRGDLRPAALQAVGHGRVQWLFEESAIRNPPCSNKPGRMLPPG